MEINATGIEVEKTTIRWFELAVPVVVPLISVMVSLWVAKAVYEERFSNQQQRIAAIEQQQTKQDDRIAAIYQALADIRSGVSEIRGRLSYGEAPK